MDKQLENVLNRMSGISVEITSINERLNRGLGQLLAVEKKSEGIDKAMMVIPTVESLRCQMADTRTEFLNRDAEVRKMLSSVSLALENFNEALKDLKDQVESINTATQKLEFDRKHELECIKDLIVHLNNKTSSDLNQKLDNLKKDLVVSPKDISAQNETLLKRIDAASMDGTNAMMKVNAQDLNLRILDKKIENLAIQIKRIDLTQQLES